MADDDIIIPPIDDDEGDIIIGDDDIPVIEEEGEVILIDGDDLVTEQYDGTQTTIQRTYDMSSDVNELSRSFTQIDKGRINFGYRDENSSKRTISYSVIPNMIYSSIEGKNVSGLTCNAKKIKIQKDYSVRSFVGTKMYTVPYMLKIGTSIPATGYLQVITNITKSKFRPSSDYWSVDWTVERLPFQNGLCISRR